MKTLSKNFNGSILNFKWSKGNGFLPMSNSLLIHVGLPNTADYIDKVYDLLGAYQYSKVLRFVAYLEDISIKTARKRLVNYLLMDFGCRITWSGKFKNSDFIFNRDYIIGLNGSDYNLNTNRKIVQMTNKLGFNIDYKAPQI
ncbi:MAG: hypothetical protein PHP53_07340 [Prolixibacteraceae bacterium]|nr:hypothetical protein [Prolixibacteraceae bacterium]